MTRFSQNLSRAIVLTMAAMLLSNSALVKAQPFGQAQVDIVTPAPQARLSALPVQINVRFNVPVDPASFSATLNGVHNVTNQFSVGAASATAGLDVQHGVRPSLGASQQAGAPNVLTVRVRSTSDGRWYQDVRQFFVNAPQQVPSTTATIPATGGQISLPNYGAVLFPQGAFPRNQSVRLSATTSPTTADELQVSGVIFSIGIRLPYELRVNTGNVRTSTPFTVTIPVSDAFLAQIPSGSEIQVLAQIFEDGGNEVLDNFEIFPSSFSTATKTVTVVLPPSAFTNRRDLTGTFEAIIVLATTATKPAAAAATRTVNAPSALGNEYDRVFSSFTSLTSNLAFRVATTQACEGSTLGAPLGTLDVSSPFNGTTHFGTDYVADNGTAVFAMSDGVIDVVGFDERPLPQPDPRSGKMVKGWGRYVVLKHTDGSKTLYAHLDQSFLAVDDEVQRGDTLGLSDNTGGSSGPHLHVEYAPNGQIFQRVSKVDPHPCIDQSATPFTNGGFELGVNPDRVMPAGSTDITGWTVLPFNVDWVSGLALGLAASEGRYFIDLNGFNCCGSAAGGIEQRFSTRRGAQYRVLFDLNANVDNRILEAKGVRVSAAATSALFTYTPSVIGINPWVVYEFVFTATTSETTLRFESQAGGVNGPVLDNVRVTEISP